MPIGFWAISRKTLREAIRLTSGANPSNYFFEQVVRETEGRLNETLQEIIDKAAKEVKKGGQGDGTDTNH